jgi:hypothetical protein
VAERFIGTITQRAWTILLHAMSKWPSTITEELWPFALRHAVNFHNASIRKRKLSSPYETFTGQTAPWSIKDFRIFCSPTYVLQKAIQDSNTYSKWKSRAWTGVYIGNSTCHLSAIPLIYNPISTHISPQFHVVYDEYFHTVDCQSPSDRDAYLECLFQTSARWLYKDEYSDKPHLFESFWQGYTHRINPKKRRSTQQASPPEAAELQDCTTGSPSRGSTQRPTSQESDTIPIGVLTQIPHEGATRGQNTPLHLVRPFMRAPYLTQIRTMPLLMPCRQSSPYPHPNMTWWIGFPTTPTTNANVALTVPFPFWLPMPNFYRT